jgi:hypothetical protein
MIAAAERTLQRAIEHGDTRAAMWLLERLAPEYRPVRPALVPHTPEAQDYRVELEVVDAPEVSVEELLREARVIWNIRNSFRAPQSALHYLNTPAHHDGASPVCEWHLSRASRTVFSPTPCSDATYREVA